MRWLCLIVCLLASGQLPAAAPEPPDPSTAEVTARTEAAKQPLQVVMYGTRECGYCLKARGYFDRRGIEFVEHDVGVSVEAFDEFEGLGGYVVPMFVINGSISHGFSNDQEMDQRLAAFGW